MGRGKVFLGGWKMSKEGRALWGQMGKGGFLGSANRIACFEETFFRRWFLNDLDCEIYPRNFKLIVYLTRGKRNRRPKPRIHLVCVWFLSRWT